MNHFELVAPSQFYNCGGRWSGSEGADRTYIALVPASRYIDPEPEKPAPKIISKIFAAALDNPFY